MKSFGWINGVWVLTMTLGLKIGRAMTDTQRPVIIVLAALLGWVVANGGVSQAEEPATTLSPQKASFVQKVKLTGSDTEVGDNFGFSVAIDGDTLVVGAPQVFEGDSIIRTGAAYVFVRSGSTWSEQAKLTASDSANSREFGYAVAIDGDTVVVGASGAFEDDILAGATYVFVRSDVVDSIFDSGEMNWSEQARLTTRDAKESGHFGDAVAIDGDTAVIGAFFADVVGNSGTGAAYVFTRSEATWSEEAKLRPRGNDAGVGGEFGQSVAIDGDTIVVGAPEDEVGTGAAYIHQAVGSSM